MTNGKKNAGRTTLGILTALVIAALAAPTLHVLNWALFRQEPPINAWTMLFAAKESGMTPTAFYASGTLIVGDDATVVANAAKRALRGIPNARVEQTESDGLNCVAVSIACPPDPWSAAETLHRINSALGMRASVTLCLAGRSSGSEAKTASLSMLAALGVEMLDAFDHDARFASACGRGAQTAVRANGEAYIGVPWIPIDF